MSWKFWKKAKSRKRKAERPEPAEKIRRKAHLDLEMLERRWLFSLSAWLPRTPIVVGAAADFHQDPFFGPLTPLLNPQYAVGGNVTASLAVLGSFTFDDTGVYTFAIHLQGSNATNCITFDDAGTSTFTLHEGGTVNNGLLSFNSYSLSQNALASWHFVETTLAGQTVQNTSGTDTLNVTDTSPGISDYFHWYGFNWYSLVNTTSNQHGLSLNSYSLNSLSVNESGSFSLFTYQEKATATLTESSNSFTADNDMSRPPGGYPVISAVGDPSGGLSAVRPGSNVPTGDSQSSSTLSFSFTQTGSYTFTNTSTNGTFTLAEGGTSNAGCYSLSSVLYNETGARDSYTLYQTGMDTVLGNGTTTASGLLQAGFESGTYASTNRFGYSNLASYTYQETGNGTHTASEAGTYGTGSFSMPSALYNATGTTGNFNYQSAGAHAFSGTGTSVLNTSGGLTNATDGGFQSFGSSDNAVSTSMNSYSFQGGDTFTYNSRGTDTYSALETGSFAAGSFAVASLTFKLNGTATPSYQATATQTASGNGTTTTTESGHDNGSSNDSGTGSSGADLYTSNTTSTYNFGSTETTTTILSQTWTFALTAPGSYSNGTYGLNSFAYSASGPGSYSLQLNSLQTETGTSNGSTTVTGSSNNTTANYDFTSGSGANSYTSQGNNTVAFGGYTSFTANTGGNDTYSAYLAGSFSNGTYSLNSVLYQDNANTSGTYQQTGTDTFSGTATVSTSYGNNAGGTSSSAGETFASTGTTGYASLETYNATGIYTSQGTFTSSDSYSFYGAGAYAAGRYSLPLAIVADSGSSGLTALGTSAQSMTGQGTSTTTLKDNVNSASSYGYESSGINGGTDSVTSVDSYTFNAAPTATYNIASTDSYSGYLAGSYANASYSLSSVVFQHHGTSSAAYGGSNLETLNGTGTMTSVATYPGMDTTSYGGDTSGSSGTLTVSSIDTYSYGGVVTSTDSGATGSVAVSAYQAGQWANGSFSFSSAVFQDSGSNTWSFQVIDNELTTGGGTATTGYGGASQESMGFGGTSYSATGVNNSTDVANYTFTSSSATTLTNAGTDTFSNFLGGAYAAGSYSFSNVSLLDNVNSNTTLTHGGTDAYHGVDQSNATFSSLGTSNTTFGYVVSANTNNATSTSNDNATYTSTDSYSSREYAFDSFSLYEGGSYANQSYSFASYLFQAQGHSTFNLQSAGTLSSLATGMQTATASLTDHGNVSYGYNTAAGADTVSITSYFSYTDSGLATYASNDSATDSYANFQAGSFALGSLGLSSTTWQDQTNESYTLNATMSESYAGVGTLTQAGTATDNSQSSYGYTGAAANGTSTFGSTDTFNYSSLASVTASETGVLSSSYYGAGSFTNGDYNLSSVLFQSSSASTDTLSAAGSDTYAGAGNSYTNQTGTGSGNGNYNYGSFAGSGNSTQTSFNSYSFGASDCFASNQTAVYSSTAYQAGSYAAGSYALSSVVMNDSGSDSYSYSDLETWSESDTAAGTLVSNNADGNYLGSNNSGASSLGSFLYTSNFYQSATETLTINALASGTDCFSNYQAGSRTNGAYSLNSVVLQSAGTTSWNETDTSSQTLANTLSGSSTQTSTSNMQEGGFGGNFNQVDTSSSQGTSTAAYLTVTSEVGTTSFAAYSAGSFAGDSYSFASYSYREASASTYGLGETYVNTSGGSMSENSSESSSYAITSQGAAYQGTDGYSSSSGNNSTYTILETYTSNLTATSSYSVYLGGVSNHGSFSLTSVVYQQNGLETLSTTYRFNETQQGTVSSSYSDSGTMQIPTGSGNGSGQHSASYLLGTFTNSGNRNSTFFSSESLSASASAVHCYSLYQAGSWANGSFAYASVNFNGSGTSNSNYNLAGTYSSSGSANENYSSSGAAASGPNMNVSTSVTSLYTFTGTGLTSGFYQLSELGSYANGSYNLSCMAYTAHGFAQQNFAMVGGDSESANNYTASDNYVGGTYFQDQYNLSEVGIYTNGSWALGSFTEAEGSTSAASSTSTGSYTNSAGAIASTGTYMSIQGTAATFAVYGNGVYANGSFSFNTFTADLDANSSMYYEEHRSDATYLSDQRIDNATAEAHLQETGGSTVSLLLGQGANYTLTVQGYESHWVSQTLRSSGVTTTASGSSAFTNVQTGSFSLAAGNPYLPPYGGANQAGGQGVGLLLPWSEGGGGGDLPGNRVSPSLMLINPSNVFPTRTGNPTDGGLGLNGNQQGNGGPPGMGQGSGQGQGGEGTSPGSGGGYSLSGMNGTQTGYGQLQAPMMGPDQGQYQYASMQPCNCGSSYYGGGGGGMNPVSPQATTDTGGTAQVLPPGTPLPETPYPDRTLRGFTNFFGGISDGATGNLTKRIRGWMGTSEFVNENSGTFKWGHRSGVALGVVTAAANPCGMGALAANGLRGLNALGAIESGIRLGEDLSDPNASPLSVGLDMLGVYMGARGAFGSCFAAGTPLLTPTGQKRIEEFRPGDWILTAPENDPDAPLEAKEVEEAFNGYARLWYLHIGGKVIRTTDEHPFFVRGKGWTPTKALQAGDMLRSHDGRWVDIKHVRDSGESAPVYNLRIADYHTYFVGDRRWDFSVWAHNACPSPNGKRGNLPHQDRVKEAQDALNGLAGWEHVAGGTLAEEAVKVGGGRIRFPDLIFEKIVDGTPLRIAVQVGKATTRDPRAIAREMRALMDLRKAKKFCHVFFLKYR